MRSHRAWKIAAVLVILVAKSFGTEVSLQESPQDSFPSRMGNGVIADGIALFRAGRYPEAQAKFESALLELERRPDSDPETSGWLMNNIALALQRQSRTAQAVVWFRDALGQFQGKLSPSLESRVTSNLAIAYSEMGDLNSAEEWAHCAVRVAEGVFGKSGPETLISLTTLAAIHYQRGEFARAEPILKRALFVLEKEWGSDAYEVAVAAGNLADVYRAQGRYREATQLYRSALLGLEKNLPRARFDIPTLQASLMIALFSAGAEREAEELLESTLATAGKLVGEQSVYFGVVLQFAAEMRFRQRKYGPAKQFMEQALGILELLYGPDAPELRNYLVTYSSMLRGMKNKTQAKEVDARIRKLAGASH